MLLNTYEHGYVDGRRGYASILHRSEEYLKGYEEGARVVKRDLHITSALFIFTVLFGVCGIGLATVMS